MTGSPAYGRLATAILVVGLSAIVSFRPGAAADQTTMDFDRLARVGQAKSKPLQFALARDGASLAYRDYGGSDDRVLILYHGSGTEGGYLDPLARWLAGAGLARVIVPNARGHFRSGPRRGDIDHVGQLEEDLRDLIDQLNFDRSDISLYLAGHSSGGGFAARYAGSKYGRRLAGLILLAPYFGYRAPSSRKSSGGWVNVDTARIIQISYLNGTGDRSRNGETVLTFNMPLDVRTGAETLAYSYRLMTNFGSGADYSEDIAGIGVPILVLAGAADGAMNSSAYADMFAAKADATVQILDGVGHLDIVSNATAMDRISSWLTKR